MPPPTPEEMAAMGAVQVLGANGQPTWTTPDAATRLGLTAIAPGDGSPEADAIAAGYRAPTDAEVAREAMATIQATAPRPPSAVAAPAAPVQAHNTTPTNLLPGEARGADVFEAFPATHAASAPRQPAPQQQQQMAGGGGPSDYQRLANRATQGDRDAMAALTIASRQGDPEAQRVLGDLNALAQAGVLQPVRTGGGGPRVTQTATTSLTQAGRAPTEEEAAGLDTARQASDDAERRQIDAMTAQAESEARALRQGAERMQRAQTDLDAMREQQETAQRARQAQLASRERELDGVLRDVGSRRVDANNLFAKGNTRNRFSAAIGMGLASLGDVIAGTNNGMSRVMGIINGAVEADIEAQRANIANASSAASQRKGLLADMRARFGSEEAAESAAKAAMLEDAARQVRALQATAQGEQRTAQLAQLLAQLDAGKAAEMQRFIVSNLGTTQIERVEQRRSGGGGQARPQFNYAAGLPEEAPEIDRAEAQSLATAERDGQKAIETIDRALEAMDNTMFVGRVMGEVPAITDDAARLDQSLAQTVLPIARALFGTLNESEKASAAADLGLSRDQSETLLRENLARARRDIQNDLRAAQQGVNLATVRANRRREAGIAAEVVDRVGRDEDRNTTFQESPR